MSTGPAAQQKRLILKSDGNRTFKVSFMKSFDRNYCIFCFQKKESTSFVIYMGKFIICNDRLKCLQFFSTYGKVCTYVTFVSIGTSCFETFKKKLSLYVVFIIMDIAES